VAELAEVLKRHPPRPSARQGHSSQLYLLDLVAGGTTLIVDEALPGKTYNGVAKWSHDGRRIAFATEGTGGRRVMMLEHRGGRPSLTDLGPGTCPNFSRDDKRIAFLLNPGALPGQEAGIWAMQADGSERQRVGDDDGAPFWSRDGREFLMNSFDEPIVATVINLEAVTAGVVAVPGYRLFSWARWAGPGQLVACLGTKNVGEMIALLDVRDLVGAKIIKLLWRRGPELDVFPRWPLYSPESGRCFFVGDADGNRRALYSVGRGDAGRAVRMLPSDLYGLAVMDLSPDGRYLVFAANQPERR
jgi:dipeptidyl aminopeptidase/acylaminoacyl peptidase